MPDPRLLDTTLKKYISTTPKHCIVGRERKKNKGHKRKK